MEDAEPTPEQRSAPARRVVTNDNAPYADLAVWCPFGRRGLRANKYRCWFPAGDGTFTCREVPGPENLVQWEASYRVFTVACMMLRVVSRAALDLYGDTVRRLVATWPNCWHLVAMADDKMRAEHLLRIRRSIAAEQEAGTVLPDPEWAHMPWSACYKRAALDERFWDLQVRHPAAAWTARGGRGAPRAPEEEIARTVVPGGAAALVPEVERVAESPNKRKREARKTRIKQDREELKHLRFPPAPPSRTPDETGGSTSGGKGKHKGKRDSKTDQAGVQLCINYDRELPNSECGKMGPNSTCPNNRAHKCFKCLSPAHRTRDCPR